MNPLLEQTSDPTRYKFPQFYSPSLTDHIAKLEEALAAAVDDNAKLTAEVCKLDRSAISDAGQSQLKQRISDRVANLPRIYCPDTEQLLRDCLKHIEELEQGTGNAVIVKQNEVIIQLQSQLREREADCAAMRDALEYCRNYVQHEPYGTLFKLAYVEQALSPNAGRELLERLKAVEKELEQKKVRVARLSLAAIEAKECIIEWVAAGLITLSPDD